MYRTTILASLLLLTVPSITAPVLEARGGGIIITPNGPVDTRVGGPPGPAANPPPPPPPPPPPASPDPSLTETTTQDFDTSGNVNTNQLAADPAANGGTPVEAPKSCETKESGEVLCSNGIGRTWSFANFHSG